MSTERDARARLWRHEWGLALPAVTTVLFLIFGNRRFVAPRRGRGLRRLFFQAARAQSATRMFHSMFAPDISEGRPRTGAPLVLLPTLRQCQVWSEQIRK
jgi:hypothetical protein